MFLQVPNPNNARIRTNLHIPLAGFPSKPKDRCVFDKTQKSEGSTGKDQLK